MNPTKYFSIGLLLLWGYLYPLVTTAQMVWQPTSLTQPNPVFCFYSQEDTLFASLHGKGLFKTVDEGLTWIDCNNGLKDPRINAMTELGDMLFVGSFSGVYSSVDNGESWQSANDSIIKRGIWSLAAKDSLLIAGTSFGIYLSSNKGQNWRKANLPRSKGHHQIIFDIGINEQKIVGSSSRYVYESQDNGDTWRRIRVPTEFAVARVVNYQDELWVATGGDGAMPSPTTGSGSSIIEQTIDISGNVMDMIDMDGILVTSVAINGLFMDGTPINEGFLQPQVNRLAYHQGVLYAGTFNMGVWKYDLIPDPLQETEERQEEPPLITWKDLKVFPNPVGDGQVQIWYQVPELSNVSIEFYHANGQPLATIRQEQQTVGEYNTTFDLSNYSPGSYYFLYRADGDVIARPVFIVQ